MYRRNKCKYWFFLLINFVKILAKLAWTQVLTEAVIVIQFSNFLLFVPLVCFPVYSVCTYYKPDNTIITTKSHVFACKPGLQVPTIFNVWYVWELISDQWGKRVYRMYNHAVTFSLLTDKSSITLHYSWLRKSEEVKRLFRVTCQLS